jgi:hypothetical protein
MLSIVLLASYFILFLTSLKNDMLIESFPDWNMTMLSGYPSLPVNPTLDNLKQREILEYNDMGCLYNAGAPHHSVNKWRVWNTEMVADENFLNGTTLWINEHMVVGHVMYDLFIMEAMRSSKIDRIFIQRAPCINADLCIGIGSWGSFFRGFYTAVIDAFQPGVPIFMRWDPRIVRLSPFYLIGNTTNIESEFLPEKIDKTYTLNNKMCLERVIRRKCNECFWSGVSSDSAARFKVAAYKLLKDRNLLHHFVPGEPINVLFAHRGNTASRKISNIGSMLETLRSIFQKKNNFNLVVKCTSFNDMNNTDQISMVANAQVVISEHGAFQSNIMYMRKGSLFVELRGNYAHGEFVNFEHLARIFGVFYAHVVTKNLDWHKSKGFNISVSEITEVVSLVHRYSLEKPYSFNVKGKS